MALAALLTFILNTLSGIVALLTSYYAYRFGRVAGNSLLKAISFGFMLLGLGLFLEAGTSVVLGRTLVGITKYRTLTGVESLSYLTIQMAAYLVFALGYGYMAFGKSDSDLAGSAGIAVAAAAAASSARALGLTGLYRYAVASYFVVFLLLAFVVFQGILIHSKSRSRFSLWVLGAFSLVLVAHVLLLAAVVALSGNLFLVGTSVQFLGFVSLLVFLLRSGRVGAG